MKRDAYFEYRAQPGSYEDTVSHWLVLQKVFPSYSRWSVSVMKCTGGIFSTPHSCMKLFIFIQTDSMCWELSAETLQHNLSLIPYSTQWGYSQVLQTSRRRSTDIVGSIFDHVKIQILVCHQLTHVDMLCRYYLCAYLWWKHSHVGSDVSKTRFESCLWSWMHNLFFKDAFIDTTC